MINWTTAHKDPSHFFFFRKRGKVSVEAKQKAGPLSLDTMCPPARSKTGSQAQREQL